MAITRPLHHARFTAVVASLSLLALPLAAQVPGGCITPASERRSEAGCYLSAIEQLDSLPSGPLFWHLYDYPTRAAAESAKAPNEAVVEAFGRVWLYTIARLEWHPRGGRRVATVGPLPLTPGRSYTARYMEAVSTRGMRSSIHRHSGPEAWYLVSGGQCLETPNGTTVVRAGASAVVPEGPPMALSTVGSEKRRAVVLVLHDSSRPWVAMATDWSPKGLCEQE